MKNFNLLVFLLVAITSFAQGDSPEITEFGGVVVKQEYPLDYRFYLSKNGQNKYEVSGNTSNKMVAIYGVNKSIGQYVYSQVISAPDNDALIFLDNKSQTATTSSFPRCENTDKEELKLLSPNEISVSGKNCIIYSFEKPNYICKLWVTPEKDKLKAEASSQALSGLFLIENMLAIGDVSLTDQVWMKLEVKNKKTDEITTYTLSDYYETIHESIMMFDYQFVTPKWD